VKFFADIQDLGLPSGSVAARLRCIGEIVRSRKLEFVIANLPMQREFGWGESLVVIFGVKPNKETALDDMRAYVTEMFPGEAMVLHDWPEHKKDLERLGIRPKKVVGLLIPAFDQNKQPRR
jgi:hypothetical protein